MRVSFVFALALVLIVALQGCLVEGEERTFTFGISLALDAPPGQYFAGVQVETLHGITIWKEWWNSLSVAERTMKNGDSFKVELHIERFSNYTDLEVNKRALFNTYAAMFANTSIDFLFMPVASPWDIPFRNYSYYELGVPFTVAMALSSEAYFAIPGSYGAVTANIFAMTSYLPYLRVAKASKVAVVYVDEVYQVELCYGVTSQAALNSLSVVAEYVMPFDYDTFGDVKSNQTRMNIWISALDAIIEHQVDALFICDYGSNAEFAVSYLKKKGWAPKSLTLSTLFTQWEDPSNLDYITTLSSYNKNARFPAQASFGDSATFDQLMRQRFGVAASHNSARAALGGMIFTQAIKNAKDNSTAAINTALATGQFSSFMGTSAFDTSSRQTLASLAIQMMNSTKVNNVIGPALAAADTLVYPIPSWDERIFNPKWGNGTEIAGAVLMCIGGVATIAWIIFLIVHWNHRVIVAASPLFLLTILLGSLIVYVSIFSWMPNLINSSICNLRAWLLPLGFMTMFGALLAKTHRIHRLYNSKGIAMIVIRNIQVALITLIIVVGQAVLSILMITVTKLDSTVKIVDPYRVSRNYYVCTFSTALKILLGLNVGYAFLLLVWGSYLAYRIRKVPISIYDESKVIAFSIYNTCFFGIIVIVIQLAVGNSSRYLTFMITAVCCFLGAMITTGCLFGAKVWAIYKPGRDLKSSGTLGTSSSGESRSKPNSAGSVVVTRDENAKNLKKYKRKYKATKEVNKDLKERVRQLESLAKSHGFLQEETVEMDEPPLNVSQTKEKLTGSKKGKASANGSSAVADKYSPKPPMNGVDDSSSDSS